MSPGFLKGKRVLIKPLQELGTVTSHHVDDRDEPVIVVIRDSDGERHCCRMCELVPQFDEGALFEQYCEVLAALESLVPVMQNIMLHQGPLMTPADRISRNSILSLCEETLDKYRVSSEDAEEETVGAVGE